MSYSFVVRAADKAEAKTMVAAELAKVTETQPAHAADQAQAQAAADAFIDLLVDDASMDVRVNVHGSVSWLFEKPPTLIGASVGVSASLIARPGEPETE
jgi:hypothetical protein